MWLMQPLPLQSLACSFMAFQVSVSKTAQVVGRKANASAVTDIVRIPALSFVARREVLELLVWASQDQTVPCGTENSSALEQRLAAIAHDTLGSSPLSCVLDGCAPASAAALVSHADEVACHGVRLLRRLVTPLPLFKNAGLAWSAELRQCAALVTTPEVQDAINDDVTLLPPSRIVAPSTVGIARDVFAGLSEGDNAQLLYGHDAMKRLMAEPKASRRVLIVVHSFDASPFDFLHSRMLRLPRSRNLWIVRDAAILLLCNNAKHPTASLVARLRSYVQRSRWLVHSPINPGKRGENNPGYLCGETASLVQAAPVWSRYEWVLYSNPDVVVTPELFANLAARIDKEDTKTTPVDLIVDRFPGGFHNQRRYSMEFVVMRTARISSATAPLAVGKRVATSAGLTEARAWHAAQTSLVPPVLSVGAEVSSAWATAASPPMQAVEAAGHVVSAFADILLRCVVERGNIPEYLLHVLEVERGLRVAKLGAVQYLTFNKMYNFRVRNHQVKAGPKTFLYPGSVWHNHNETQVTAYLHEQERNASAMTQVEPSDEELKHYPYS